MTHRLVHSPEQLGVLLKTTRKARRLTQGEAPSQINVHDAKLAMNLRGKNRHRKLFEIQQRHFDSTAQLCGLDSANALIERILALKPRVIEQAQQGLPHGFSQPVLDRTLTGLADMAARLGHEAD